MTPTPDKNDRADRFDATMEKDMELNEAIGRAVVDVHIRSSFLAIQKGKKK